MVHHLWSVCVCVTESCRIWYMSVITSTPRCFASSVCVDDWDALLMFALSFFRCTSLSKDLYTPRCQPDGDVNVFSGHFLKPSVSFSKFSGCGWAMKLFGRRWCLRNTLVALSIGSSSISAVPLRTFLANGVTLSDCRRSDRGVS